MSEDYNIPHTDRPLLNPLALHALCNAELVLSALRTNVAIDPKSMPTRGDVVNLLTTHYLLSVAILEQLSQLSSDFRTP